MMNFCFTLTNNCYRIAIGFKNLYNLISQWHRGLQRFIDQARMPKREWGERPRLARPYVSKRQPF